MSGIAATGDKKRPNSEFMTTPTGGNLIYTLAPGVLGNDKTRALAHFSLRLHRLGLGYSYMLDHLSQTLDIESHETMSARLAETIQRHSITISGRSEPDGIST